jgi:hypothetical protein
VSALSDFRIVLPPDVEFSTRELDWIESKHHWRLSNIEYGSVTWEFDLAPSEVDLTYIRDFFEVPRDLSLAALAKLSPGELVAIHSQSHESSRIRAVRCEACGENWIVYKLSDDATWLKYGRKCANNGWWLGDQVSESEAMSAAGI